MFSITHHHKPDEKALKQKINELVAAKEWRAALVEARKLLDAYHVEYEMWEILEPMKPNVEKLRNDNSGSSWCLLGLMYYGGEGGVEKDSKEAYRCFSRAADMHHIYALYEKGWMLWFGYGVARDKNAGGTCFATAAKAGCRDAFWHAGRVYEIGRGVARDYFKAAVCYIKGEATYFLNILLKSHPDQCVPWGRWTPDPLIQQLVPDHVMGTMYMALLVCKRLGVNRHVALIVVTYVCTSEKV